MIKGQLFDTVLIIITWIDAGILVIGGTLVALAMLLRPERIEVARFVAPALIMVMAHVCALLLVSFSKFLLK